MTALAAAPLAPVYALFLGTFAANKVQGLALAKAVGVVVIPAVISYFVTGPWQTAFGLVPHYWPPKAFWLFDQGAIGQALAHAIVGVIWHGALLMLLMRRFSHAVRREC